MNEMICKSENMSNLIRHIESNLISDMNTEWLSNISYVSHTQLYRDFYSLTGHTVKEYIRKRRLSNALALIKTSDFELADIAYQCGYSSQQSLCRAVRQTLDLAPLEYKRGDAYYFFPPFNGEPLQSVIVSSETIPKTLCIRFYHSSLRNIENRAVNTFLGAVPDYGGRVFGRNGKQDGSKFCYELYLTDTDRDYSILEAFGFKILTVKIPFAATFATSTVQNNEQKINTAWDYLFSGWLQNSMFEYTNEPYYEEYILKNKKSAKLKLYLPIKKRGEETKIILVNNPGLHFTIAKAKGYNAEKIAAKTVINYLSANYPHIVQTSKEFYLHKEINSCVCGVRSYPNLRIWEDENIENIVTSDSNYLVLESCVMGDYDRYADLLLSFAQDNGMAANKKEIFAVYNIKKSFKN